jgi:hypothetical protein
VVLGQFLVHFEDIVDSIVVKSRFGFVFVDFVAKFLILFLLFFQLRFGAIRIVDILEKKDTVVIDQQQLPSLRQERPVPT